MYDHVSVKVKDLDASARFYEAALGTLGLVHCSQDAASAGFGPKKDEPALWLLAHADTRGPGTHLAFRAKDRGSVDRFHAAALKAGGRDNGGPGIRADYGPTYYAAFVLDPDGNNIEAVCLK